MNEGGQRFIWTSGRKCNFGGCDGPELQPINVNGWFWSATGMRYPTMSYTFTLRPSTSAHKWKLICIVERTNHHRLSSGERLAPTTNRLDGEWSDTGGADEAQPDNREFKVTVRAKRRMSPPPSLSLSLSLS